MEKLLVRRDALEAYERLTGFTGIGRFMLERGVFEIVEENRCKNK
jgi:hypothetical protein